MSAETDYADFPPLVMTFSASDPSGGSGMQADVLTLASMGCHPLTIVTALTVQDTLGMADVVGRNTNGADMFSLRGRYADIRPGAYEVNARLVDMDEGDVLAHVRLLPGFDDEMINLGTSGYSLHVHQDDDETIHVLVVK